MTIDAQDVAGTNQVPAEAPNQTPEKMLSQSEVNEIVGRVKREEAQKAVDAYKRQQPSQPDYSQSHQSSNRGLTEEDIRRMTSEQLHKEREQWARENEERSNLEEAQRVVKTFWDKVTPGKDKYEDFDKVAGSIEFKYYPNVVQLLAEQVDNAPDVLYELGNNRLKLSQLEAAAQLNSRDAIHEIKRLSESLKANESASRGRMPNAPLSQLKPSTTGTDSGILSMADLKKKYRG